MVESAIYQREREFGAESPYQGGVGEVDVDISVERALDVDELEARLQEGNPQALTPEEIGVLVRAGRLDPADLGRLRDSDNDRLNPATRRALAHDEERDEHEG